MASGKTRTAFVAGAGAAILFLVVVAHRPTERVNETAVSEAPEQAMTEEDRQYFHYRMNSLDCSGLVSLSANEGCGHALSREEWERSQKQLVQHQEALEVARAENTVLQERLRAMEEHDAPIDSRGEGKTPSSARSKLGARTNSGASGRGSKRSRSLAEESLDEPLTDYPLLD